MESIYILIPLSIVLVLIIGIVLWWSSKSGQFDDLDGPGYRVIMDDDSTDNLAEHAVDEGKTTDKDTAKS